ncbi:unnamed protein product [Caenorhabditis brenneri]
MESIPAPSNTRIHVVHAIFITLYFIKSFQYSAFVSFSILYVCNRAFCYNGREERKSVLLRTIKVAFVVNMMYLTIFIYCFACGIYKKNWESVNYSMESMAIASFLALWTTWAKNHVTDFPEQF